MKQAQRGLDLSKRATAGEARVRPAARTNWAAGPGERTVQRVAPAPDSKGRQSAMAPALYKVTPTEGGWSVHHDEEASAAYELLESAFEAACAAASVALKQGQDVTITVEQRRASEAEFQGRAIGEAFVHPEIGRASD